MTDRTLHIVMYHYSNTSQYTLHQLYITCFTVHLLIVISVCIIEGTRYFSSSLSTVVLNSRRKLYEQQYLYQKFYINGTESVNINHVSKAYIQLHMLSSVLQCVSNSTFVVKDFVLLVQLQDKLWWNKAKIFRQFKL